MRELVRAGLPLKCLREVRRVFPRVRFTPPRACLLSCLLASKFKGRSAGARLMLLVSEVRHDWIYCLLFAARDRRHIVVGGYVVSADR